ncbi:MAG: NAD(P)-binding domain-containing protein, partial [Oscillospiraceae bacterium]|nr:NAD(P)-binding domain-containing protein [Oscillospiraceae bacterium]
LGKRCVVIGGSESGTEAGLYLAENGHQVTILTRADTLAEDATPIHYRETIDEYYQTMDNISYVTGATTEEIGNGYVTYRTADGATHRLECDSVVALGGMASRRDEAMAMYGVTADTFMIGDCQRVGNLHTCNRGAYSVVHNL